MKCFEYFESQALNRRSWSIWAAITSIALGGCAGRAPAPEPSAMNADSAIVFGRDVVLLDGEVVTGHEVKQLLGGPARIESHVSPYVSDALLIQSGWVPGKYFISALGSDDGYFAIVLPPGRYYFVEHLYKNEFPMPYNMMFMRSYMNTTGGRAWRPFITTFEAVPGKATYIGTLYHEFQTVPGQSTRAWGLRISSERGSSDEWLLRHYPQLADRLTAATATSHPLEGR